MGYALITPGSRSAPPPQRRETTDQLGKLIANIITACIVFAIGIGVVVVVGMFIEWLGK